MAAVSAMNQITVGQSR